MNTRAAPTRLLEAFDLLGEALMHGDVPAETRALVQLAQDRIKAEIEASIKTELEKLLETFFLALESAGWRREPGMGSAGGRSYTLELKRRVLVTHAVDGLTWVLCVRRSDYDPFASFSITLDEENGTCRVKEIGVRDGRPVGEDRFTGTNEDATRWLLDESARRAPPSTP